ncbi:hypothetical protein [Methylomicrobium sp. Wu6]|uniref:hypothetical protein n=1 Tax=Methylomicrobium sp. Wu6 TaxID=3107928 RepID=UPI002DD667F6|nr:hypothetical protein [Methylomicrobium sp. Wu6]MEC4747403.1 hypothetical protein [Methylomicrobium sp. Wu6]
MNVKDVEIQALTEQLKEWNIQMGVLAAKQEAAAAAAKNFAHELDALRSKYHATAQQLRKREEEETGFNMWENIGEGG